MLINPEYCYVDHPCLAELTSDNVSRRLGLPEVCRKSRYAVRNKTKKYYSTQTDLEKIDHADGHHGAVPLSKEEVAVGAGFKVTTARIP